MDIISHYATYLTFLKLMITLKKHVIIIIKEIYPNFFD